MASRRVALAASAVLVISSLAVPAATAGDSGLATVPAAPVDVNPTCAVGADPIEAGPLAPAVAELPEPVIDCFPTFAAAMEFVTGGALVAETPAQLDRLAAESPDAMATASWIVLGYEYKSTGYSGGSLVLYGTSGSGCGSSTTYGFPTMPSGWNNVISSARAFNGCWSTHYDGTSYSGTRRTCTPSCSTLGTMNNRTSSIVFRPVGTYG
jgi:hypothetical protein